MTHSLLATDGYKFSMAEAGWPLRTETFYYTHRKGGPQVLPVDVKKFVNSLLPVITDTDYAFLDKYEYEMGIGFKSAIKMVDKLVVHALPKGSVFYDREPVFSITGPSAIVSWLEPLILQLNYRIQIATTAILDSASFAREVQTVTCQSQADIIRETMEAIHQRAPDITVDSDGYFNRVKKVAEELVGIVGDPNRIFEVGLRAATCYEQHEIAVSACRAAGIMRTSNVQAAATLGMRPVGTMGHEHVQRYGSDLAAYRAMRDRRPYRSSYLLDTYDTYLSGIPAAFQIIQEDPHRGDSIRYDSGDKMSQYLYATDRAKAVGIRPIHILEDGFDATQTRKFEEARLHVGWQPHEQFYGYGGFLVASPAFGFMTRDRVAAVWKLSQTGDQATMKFGNEMKAGKESIPGKPILFRLRSGNSELPVGIVGQEGEECPDGYIQDTDANGEMRDGAFTLKLSLREPKKRLAYSEATQALRQQQHKVLQRMKSNTGAIYEPEPV